MTKFQSKGVLPAIFIPYDIGYHVCVPLFRNINSSNPHPMDNCLFQSIPKGFDIMKKVVNEHSTVYLDGDHDITKRKRHFSMDNKSAIILIKPRSLFAFDHKDSRTRFWHKELVTAFDNKEVIWNQVMGICDELKKNFRLNTEYVKKNWDDFQTREEWLKEMMGIE